MSTIQPAVVSGEVIVDRWGVAGAELAEIAHVRVAYGYGYRRGWLNGFVMGLAVVGVGVLCVLFVMLS